MSVNKDAAGMVIAVPAEGLNDPRLDEATFVAVQPAEGSWGPATGIIPEVAVQGAPASFRDISAWNERGSMELWRAKSGQFFIVAQYHHGADECYRVLWLEESATDAVITEAVDYWVLTWYIDLSKQGRQLAIPGLAGVDMEASFRRVTAKMRDV